MGPSVHPLSQILGRDAGVFGRVLDDIVPIFEGLHYTFLDLPTFQSLPVPAMNQAYWTEILFRCHWVAAATLLRARTWLQGVLGAHRDTNVLALAACGRGVIEASADSLFALRHVPGTLAKHNRMIRSAVKGDLQTLNVNGELEEHLIHFTHARKGQKGESLPTSHNAKQVSEYRKLLEDAKPALAACYSTLCDVTHPGMSSVAAFLIPAEDGSTVTLSGIAQAVWCEKIRADLAVVMPAVLQLGLNSALVTLRTINVFPLEALHTPPLDRLDFSPIQAWRRVEQHLAGSGLTSA